MSILANDPFSLDARSHRRSRSRSRSLSSSIVHSTVSSFSKPPFFPSFSEQSAKALEKIASTSSVGAPSPSPNPKPTAMSLRHRQNGAPVPHAETNGVAHLNGNGKLSHDDEDKPKAVKKLETIDWEIPRKVMHSSIGFLVIYLYTSHASPHKIALVLAGNCAIISITDFVRLRNQRFASFYESALGFLMRDSERTKMNGVIWYLLGCIFVLSVYPADIAVVSILVLSWCDTTASFFGRLYGSRTSRLPQSLRLPGTKIRVPTLFAPRKSIAGFTACAVTGAVIALGFWGWLTQYGETAPSLPEPLAVEPGPSVFANAASVLKLAFVAVVTGLVAAFAEAADIGSLDDNLTLPIISGGVIWALFRCLGNVFSS